jgi:hypothetical protein
MDLKWNMSNVETIASMFEGAAAFNRDLGSWDTSNIIDGNRMFAGATSFTDGSISSWDISRMANIDEMFSGASAFDGDLSTWNLANAKSLRRMFAGADSFRQNLCTWTKYMFSNEPVANEMFIESGCPSSADPFVTARDVGPLCHYCSELPCNDNNEVTCLPFTHGNEFRRAIAAYRLDSSRYTAVASTYGHPIGKWNTSHLHDFRYAFFNDYSFTDDISEWDTSNAISMVSMFNGATWYRGDISGWDVSRVIYTSDMFKNAEWFNQDISMWNLSNIHYADRMFYGATRFNQNLCDWRSRFLFNETRRVDDMFSYSGCPNKSSPLRMGSGPYCHECPLSSFTSNPISLSISPTSSPIDNYPMSISTYFPTTFKPLLPILSPTKKPSRTPSMQPFMTLASSEPDIPSVLPTLSSMTPVFQQSDVPSSFPTVTITTDSPTEPAKTDHHFASVYPTPKSSAFPTLGQYAPDDLSGVSSPLGTQTLSPSMKPTLGIPSGASRCVSLNPFQFVLCIWAKIKN